MLAFSMLVFQGCKKEKKDAEEPVRNSILGTWELRQSYSGMTPLVNYPAGEGYKLSFEETGYTMSLNGQVMQQGTYQLTRDSVMDVNSCALIPPLSQGPNTIIYDNNPPSLKIYFEVSNNTLKTTTGCIPADGGWQIYKRVSLHQ
jgi:hypothetical protein